MGWKPIESAPRNRQWWIVWPTGFHSYDRPVIADLRMDNGSFREREYDVDLKATHWLDVEPPE